MVMGVFLCPPLASGPESDTTPYELLRSRQLNALLGPKGNPEAVDLICDLHNTTANMGLCLITYSDHDWICLHIFRYLQARANDQKSIDGSSTNGPASLGSGSSQKRIRTFSFRRCPVTVFRGLRLLI